MKKYNYCYYGLFLTKVSKHYLESLDQLDCLPQKVHESNSSWYLDHCTLMHWTKHNDLVYEALESELGSCQSIIIDGIGFSDKAAAFRVKCESVKWCTNLTPHITIVTFNGGRPVDSNGITDWIDISPIEVEAIVKKIAY